MKYKNREDYDKNCSYMGLSNCPFCTKLDKKRIIFESDFWFVIHNDNPYFDDKNGLMAIPKRHMEFTVNLQKEELTDFLQVEKFMQSFFKDKGEYFSFIRQSKSNKSVEHMHYHYLVGMPSAIFIGGEKYLKVKN